MRQQILGLSFIFLITLLLSASNVQAVDIILPEKTAAQVYFSPDGGCTNAILKAISLGRSEILIQAYSFLSPAIAQALIAAHGRGVKVGLILDKSERQEGLTPPAEMANAGIAVYLDGVHAIANNRIIIIDQKTIITGSFNFNKASEEMNAENMLVLHSEAAAKIYRDNWLTHRKHSVSF
jgi:phosphatidylserine/phosphatidylglycerophosphate/cardiolipin synthase-like enzyme